MSSVRVDSPLLSEFRRQPSPCAPTMPKPRACRKLFPVDHVETNRFLQTEIAQIDAEQQAQIGIDLGRYVPLEDQSSSRYTDWEAMPADSVPSFYRETFAKSKPISRLRMPERGSNSPHQNKNDSRIHPLLLNTNKTDGIPVVLRTHSTVGDRSFVPLHRCGHLDNSTQDSGTDTTSSKTDEPIPSVLKTLVSESTKTCRNQRHGTESVTSIPSTSTPGVDKQLVDKDLDKQLVDKQLVDKQLVDKQHTSQTQSKVTDYFRQRKRGSEISGILPDTEDSDKHHVPTKRRMRTNNPVDGGDTLPEVGQS